MNHRGFCPLCRWRDRSLSSKGAHSPLRSFWLPYPAGLPCPAARAGHNTMSTLLLIHSNTKEGIMSSGFQESFSIFIFAKEKESSRMQWLKRRLEPVASTVSKLHLPRFLGGGHLARESQLPGHFRVCTKAPGECFWTTHFSWIESCKEVQKYTI